MNWHFMWNSFPIKNKFWPGLNRWGFLTPPVAGALFLAALVASCFLGAFPPVDLRAVCFVRAIFQTHGNNRRIFAWGKNQTDTFGGNNFLGRGVWGGTVASLASMHWGSKRELSYGGVICSGQHTQWAQTSNIGFWLALDLKRDILRYDWTTLS